MTNVIDCRKCYNLHRCGGVYYCPFAGQQPCFRGKHTTHLPSAEEEAKKAEFEKDLKALTAKKVIAGGTSNETRKEIVRLYVKGIDCNKICDKVRASKHIVYSVLREAKDLGLIAHKERQDKRLEITSVGEIPAFIPNIAKSTKYDWESMHSEIFKRYNAGESLKKIGGKLGISYGALYAYLERYRKKG